MKLLLDTPVLLWWWGAAPMAPEAMAAIGDPRNLVAVSAATVWELAIQRAQGKVRFDGSIAALVAEGAFEPLPMSTVHAELAGELPPHHRDPFDRMLIAQAQAEGLRVVTRDPAFEPYGVPVVRA